jgi:predicted aldo/keto reductase-like oxidoreductase
MRYQQSWKDSDPITDESQKNVEACIRKSIELGINHIETARGYGTSEFQLGKILPALNRDSIIVQTKVGADPDVTKFVANFEKSMANLNLDYVDLFAFHGVNDAANLDAVMTCLDTAVRWKAEGRIRHIGFSTHGPLDVILKAIRTDAFEYVNLHWYYIFQDNWQAVEEGRQRDMGVFIISPNDKGGLLFQPSARLVELCAPLHPMVFNELFCLARPEVHTLSCGVACPSDFDPHMETIRLLEEAPEGSECAHAAKLAEPIVARLEKALADALGETWVRTWQEGLPEWEDTPGGVNIPVILRLRNLALAFDMVEYGKMRYNLLGNGGNWFPGEKANNLDGLDLASCLKASPHAARIPALLAETHAMLAGEEKKRLQEN